MSSSNIVVCTSVILSHLLYYLSQLLARVYTVLDSEVVDLRVCLRSADRELAELKADMKKEKKAHDTKTMDLLRRVSRQNCV